MTKLLPNSTAHIEGPGTRMSSILSIILTSCVARLSCCFFPIRVSIIFIAFMSLDPFPRQSIPRLKRPFSICCDLTCATDSIGLYPEFSARAMGMESSASAKALTAYCSSVDTLSASSATAMEQAISQAPPPYTTLSSLTRFLTTHRASCMLLFASSMIILFPPRRKMVTAFVFWHSSITSIRSFVVPKYNSLTSPAFPSLADVSSENLGTILPPVAMAISSISGPPTHLTAGSSFCSSRWLASSSNPH